MVPQVVRYFTNAKIFTGYGLTEMDGVTEGELDSQGSQGTGELLNGCTVKIIDKTGNRCHSNIIGEICIKRNANFPVILGSPSELRLLLMTRVSSGLAMLEILMKMAARSLRPEKRMF